MNDRTERKTAIFLGAGASSADNAPTKLIFEYLLHSDESIESNPQLAARKERLQSFLEFFFDTWVGPTPNEDTCPSFEEVLTVIEMAIQRKETFNRYGKGLSFIDEESTEQDLRQIHEDLVLSIAQIIALKIGAGRWHKKFVERIRNSYGLENCIFLTTNYDILLDNALTRYSNRRNDKVIPNYGFEYNIEIPDGGNRQTYTYTEGSIPLLKLHGSLNWLYCPRCIRIDLKPLYKSGFQASYEIQSCSCGQHRQPVIIPPTYLKDISNPYLVKVWNKAENELKKVDRIIFCGYSLPQSDLQIKYLLKRAQINRDDSKSLSVYVINYDEDRNGNRIIDEWILSQYQKFFGIGNVTYLAKKFEEFADRGFGILP